MAVSWSIQLKYISVINFPNDDKLCELNKYPHVSFTYSPRWSKLYINTSTSLLIDQTAELNKPPFTHYKIEKLLKLLFAHITPCTPYSIVIVSSMNNVMDSRIYLKIHNCRFLLSLKQSLPLEMHSIFIIRLYCMHVKLISTMTTIPLRLYLNNTYVQAYMQFGDVWAILCVIVTLLFRSMSTLGQQLGLGSLIC